MKQRHFQELEEDNLRLKEMLAELSLEYRALKVMVEKACPRFNFNTR